jgi:transcriptional regulator with XRE-family HTH domain
MNRIEYLIKEKGYNMTSFAEKMGVTRQNLYAILKSPSYPSLEKIAEALDVPMWRLFASDEDVSVNNEKNIMCPNCGHEIPIEVKIKNQ